jgi:hypothetical protein
MNQFNDDSRWPAVPLLLGALASFPLVVFGIHGPGYLAVVGPLLLITFLLAGIAAALSGFPRRLGTAGLWWIIVVVVVVAAYAPALVSGL